jgi:predicted esterase
MRPWLPVALSLLALSACGSSTAASTSTTGGPTTGTGGMAGTGGASNPGGAGGALPLQTEPPAAFLPQATGPCPEFAEGKATFTPDGVARDVLLWVDPAQAALKDGPLVFYWHGAGGDPSEAPGALGSALAAIKALGGVVVAPYHDPQQTLLPWYLCLGGADEGDLRVADEALACAIAKVGVDLRRIHSVGFSAGAMNTEQFAARRSGYLASIVAYSGARLGSVDEQDPANKYPAMLFFGGPGDMVVVNFADATHKYHDDLAADGHFSFLCDHGKGHTIPSDGRASAWQFLQDHPFGTRPEPYQQGLPAGFPAYCSL